MVLTRGHALLAAILIGIVPAISWLDGSGQLAWTMFTRTGHYRLEIVSIDRGAPRAVNPTSLAARVPGTPLATYLAGSDRMRHHDIARVTLRRHLDAIAELACDLGGERVRIALEERANLDAPIERTELEHACE